MNYTEDKITMMLLGTRRLTARQIIDQLGEGHATSVHNSLAQMLRKGIVKATPVIGGPHDASIVNSYELTQHGIWQAFHGHGYQPSRGFRGPERQKTYNPGFTSLKELHHDAR